MTVHGKTSLMHPMHEAGHICCLLLRALGEGGNKRGEGKRKDMKDIDWRRDCDELNINDHLNSEKGPMNDI